MLMLLNGVYPGIQGWGMPFELCLLLIFVGCNALGWFIWRYIDSPVQRELNKRHSNRIPQGFS